MLHADQIAGQQDLGGLERLPAHGGALVQGIAGAAGAEGLDDMLQAAALDIGHAVGVLADEQRAVVAQLCRQPVRVLRMNLEKIEASDVLDRLGLEENQYIFSCSSANYNRELLY